MKDGFWLNYRTRKIFTIHEHECWIRNLPNARKLGVPERVIAHYPRFRHTLDRDVFLLHLFQQAPVMRVRGHGASATFEFWARRPAKALAAIRHWCQQNAGPFLFLEIINHATGHTRQLLYQDFRAECPVRTTRKVRS